MTSVEIVRKTLSRNRTKPAIGLIQEIPISLQMDIDFCGAIEEEIGKHGEKWERRKATASLGEHIPAKNGIYMFVLESQLGFQSAVGGIFKPAWIIYIGRAGNEVSQRTLKDRYKGEYSKYIGGDPDILWSDSAVNSRAERLKKYLSIYPLWYWYCVVDDRTKICDIEDNLIKIFNPPLNKVGKARLTFSQEAPAFRRY